LRWGPQLHPRGVPLRAHRLKRPLVSRVLALYESTITQSALPGRVLGDRAVGRERAAPDPRLDRAHAACHHGRLDASTRSTYLRSERSWDFVFGILYGYFSFLRAHLDLSLRGAHAARRAAGLTR